MPLSCSNKKASRLFVELVPLFIAVFYNISDEFFSYVKVFICSMVNNFGHEYVTRGVDFVSFLRSSMSQDEREHFRNLVSINTSLFLFHSSLNCELLFLSLLSSCFHDLVLHLVLSHDHFLRFCLALFIKLFHEVPSYLSRSWTLALYRSHEQGLLHDRLLGFFFFRWLEIEFALILGRSSLFLLLCREINLNILLRLLQDGSSLTQDFVPDFH